MNIISKLRTRTNCLSRRDRYCNDPIEVRPDIHHESYDWFMQKQVLGESMKV